MKHTKDAWMKTAAALKAVGVGQPLPVDVERDAVPYGFSTRVVSAWKSARAAESRLALWQKLSWRAAFASCLVFAGTFLAQGPLPDGEGVLFKAPSISVQEMLSPGAQPLSQNK